MRFYYFEAEKIYTLKEFIQSQSIKTEDIGTQMNEVCIAKYMF